MDDILMKGFGSDKKIRAFGGRARHGEVGQIGRRYLIDPADLEDLPLPRLSIVEFSDPSKYRANEIKERTEELLETLDDKVSCITNFLYMPGVSTSMNTSQFDEILEWLIFGGSNKTDYNDSYFSSRPVRFGAGGTEIYVGIKSSGTLDEQEMLGEKGFSIARKAGLIDPMFIPRYEKEIISEIVSYHNKKF